MTKKLNDCTPFEIVEKLDEHIIAQYGAKKSVAIALRNRWRRINVKDNKMREEITPKNILMAGATGVGKTEIARRLAKLSDAPFLKVEATKFTEVGYIGKNTESIVMDLVDNAIRLVRDKAVERIEIDTKDTIEQRIVDLLIEQERIKNPDQIDRVLKEDNINNYDVEITITSNDNPLMQIFSQNGGVDEMNLDLPEGMKKKTTKKKVVKVSKAKKILLQEEIDKRLDDDEIISTAIEQAEQNGIVFIDEIDKVVGSSKLNGPDVSRQGVQRDLLPIVEGCTVATKYGMVSTKHVLFIASGAFSTSRPEDLIPEFQGRFPIRADLHDLGKKEFIEILTKPKYSITKQYIALMETENIKLDYSDSAIERIAEIAVEVNEKQENTGARRLHTLMESIVRELSFHAPTMKERTITITHTSVDEALQSLLQALDIKSSVDNDIVAHADVMLGKACYDA